MLAYVSWQIHSMHVRMDFMALVTAMVLYAKSEDSVLSVSYLGYISYSCLLDLRAEGSRVPKHVKLPRCG